jgi:hypothetical protein
VAIDDGARATVASVSPAQYSAGKWFVTPFLPVAEGRTLDDQAKAVAEARDDGCFSSFTT